MITFVPMFKKVTAITLLIALISSYCSLFMMYAGFKTNQSYITENLCVNKARPWLHCNGKCYFMKKLQQAEENEKKQEAKNNLNRLEVSFYEEPVQILFIAPKVIKAEQRIFSAYSYQYNSRCMGTIFQPPQTRV